MNKNKRIEIGTLRLQVLLNRGEFDKAKELIDRKKGDINQKLVDAVKEKNVEKVKECFNKGAKNNSDSVKENNKSTFFLAIESGNKEIVEFFISKINSEYLNSGHYIGIDGEVYLPEITPLTIAIEKGHNDIVKLLLEKGADPLKEINNEKGKNAFEYAISVNNMDALKMMFEKGSETLRVVHLFERSKDIVPFAIDHNNLKATEILIDWFIKKDKIDFTFWKGNINDGTYITPLTYAALKEKKEIVEMLLSKGAKLEFGNEYEEPVLSYLIAHASNESIEFIIDKGANVNVKYWKGITPLMHAINIRTDVVELLIKRGANVNEIDYAGKSILTRAIKEGDKKIVKMLIDNGAKVSFKNAFFHWRLIPAYLKQ